MPRFRVLGEWSGTAVRIIEADDENHAEALAYHDGGWVGFTVDGGAVDFTVTEVEEVESDA